MLPTSVGPLHHFFPHQLEQINQLHEKGIITTSDSLYNNQIVMVPKKNTSVRRICVDFRVLNSKSHPVAYSLPKIDEILHHHKNAFVISSLDLESGFLQIRKDVKFKHLQIGYNNRQKRGYPFGVDPGEPPFWGRPRGLQYCFLFLYTAFIYSSALMSMNFIKKNSQF